MAQNQNPELGRLRVEIWQLRVQGLLGRESLTKATARRSQVSKVLTFKIPGPNFNSSDPKKCWYMLIIPILRR